jgi:haloacetate dehalogenase
VFEGFQLDFVQVGDVTLRVRYGGSGPAVVLLHGHPRTHMTWEQVAPLLAGHHTVICPDLRGYGQSSKPPTNADHAPYSKRALGGDIAALMRHFGHDTYAVVGHDRGAYVAQRLAADYAAQVTHLVILDSVPIGEALARADGRFARKWWHWFFLGQTEKPAEFVINPDPDGWYRIDHSRMSPEAWSDLHAALNDPATVHAMCEDYRAGLTVDREADDADRSAGRTIDSPMLLLWAEHDDLDDLYGDPLAIWRDWATDVSGKRLPSGHHLAEEVPEMVAAEILRHLAS